MIKIENEQLASNVMFQLGKVENSFTEDDLKLVEEIVIDPVDVLGNYTPVNFELLRYFKNLKDITIRNKLINRPVIQCLQEKAHLKELCFERCDFESLEDIAKLPLNQLQLYACEIDDYSFITQMQSLSSLTIVGGNVSMNDLKLLPHLTYLRLSFSQLIDLEHIELSHIETVYLDNTNIEDFSFLSHWKSLKKVCISQKQYNNHQDFFLQLSQEGVQVLNEGFTDFNIGNED